MSKYELEVESSFNEVEFEPPRHVYRVWVDLGGERPEEAFFTNKESAEEFVMRMIEQGRHANMNQWQWQFMIER